MSDAGLPCECGRPNCVDAKPCEHCFCLQNEMFSRATGDEAPNQCCKCERSRLDVRPWTGLEASMTDRPLTPWEWVVGMAFFLVAMLVGRGQAVAVWHSVLRRRPGAGGR